MFYLDGETQVEDTLIDAYKLLEDASNRDANHFWRNASEQRCTISLSNVVRELNPVEYAAYHNHPDLDECTTVIVGSPYVSTTAVVAPDRRRP